MQVSPEIMFDPATYAKSRLPVTEAETLPAWCYTSEDYHRAEIKNLFMKVWNFFGRVDRIPEPGDFFTVTFVGVPIIIVRGKDGRVRALANTCRHRGAMVMSGEGNCRSFVCPYHGWSYDLDGRLKGAGGMDQTEDFRLEDNGLIELRLETWGGFIFVNFDHDAGPLLDYLGDFPETMASYGCENLVCTRRKIHEVDCNWKIHIENAMEDYHIPMVHKASISAKKIEHWNEPAKGNWFNMRERHDRTTRALLEEDRAHELPHIKSLEGHAAEGTNFVCLNPSTMLGMTLDLVFKNIERFVAGKPLLNRVDPKLEY
ncbi:MAG: Rieske 2Fe-2S domain-containing protein [Alphaproteobacteria bacterium]|nr:Rieske 2Fe-2S domain-containing protein [Alphaproteobacteria bacterium]